VTLARAQGAFDHGMAVAFEERTPADPPAVSELGSQTALAVRACGDRAESEIVESVRL
jgi:hypothetical protein